MKRYLYGVCLFSAVLLVSGCSLPSAGGVKTNTGVSASSIMKTVDGGKKWEPKSRTNAKVNLNLVSVLSLAINPYDGKNIFVGTIKNGILKTENGGDDWELLNFPAGKVYGIVVDNMQGNIIYATGVWQGYGKIFKSVDSGKEWDEIYTAPSSTPIIITLTMDKRNHNVLYASTSDNQLIRTSDGGVSWKNVFIGSGPIVKVSLDSVNQNLMYILMQGGKISRSSDGGNTFEDITRDIGNGGLTMEVDPVRSNVVYAGGSNGMFKSKDSGNVWEKMNILSDSGSAPVKAIAINPDNSNEIIYGAGQAVYKSIDSGQNWSPIQIETKKNISILQYNPYESNAIYLGLRD